MKIAIYTRVSTDGKGQDPQNQLRQLREFASKQDGWEITHYYNDRATGKTGDRDQFRSMLKAASQPRLRLRHFGTAIDRRRRP
jgi:DNA invertase Pin-like site-specific DNA recombinase